MNRFIRNSLSVICVACIIVGFSSCNLRNRGTQDFDSALRPGESGIQELSLAEYPQFTMAHSSQWSLKKAINHSLKYLTAPSSQKVFPTDGITHSDVRRGLELFKDFLEQHPKASNGQLNAFIRKHMRMFRSIGYDGRGTVLFTGYYTPIFKASSRRSGRYQFPLYKRPENLVSGVTSKSMSQQRLADGRLVPYPSRKTLQQTSQLRGLELVWLDNAFDAFIIHVQGSARLRLLDGREIEIGYNGTNGHDYSSVAQALIKDGHLQRPSLQSMRTFFDSNPSLINSYLNKNPRFVFFKETTGGPYGCLGQDVTADVSIATDKDIFPAGALAWVQTDSTDKNMRHVHYTGFKLDQDAGGAIRAAGRCDIYMGVGPAAERRAGRQLSHGQLYYLVAR